MTTTRAIRRLENGGSAICRRHKKCTFKIKKTISYLQWKDMTSSIQQVGTALCCVYCPSICDTHIPLLEKYFYTYLPQWFKQPTNIVQFYCELHLLYTLCVISFISNKFDILLIALLLRLMSMSCNINNKDCFHLQDMLPSTWHWLRQISVTFLSFWVVFLI